jgi:GNAT superfamily N-acetyltransferase
MIIQIKDNKQITIRKFQLSDCGSLGHYYHGLSTDTKNRFGPHRFDIQSIVDIYNNPRNFGFLAIDYQTDEIIAYSIVRTGFLEHDRHRLESYGLILEPETDAAFAPSVADEWQSFGIGNHMFHFILDDLKSKGIQRIILWGGVQCSNEKAVNYYKKNNFRILGEFWYNGANYDMILDKNLTYGCGS